MEKTNKSQITTLAVLSLLVGILVVIFFIVPQVSQIKDYSGQINQKEIELQSGQDQVQAIKEYALVLKTAKSDVEKLGVSIPTEEKADEAVLQVASAASSAGISMNSVSVSSTTTGTTNVTSEASASQTGTLTLSVSTSGGYDATLGFIKNLEKNLRPVTLSNLSIAGDAEGGSDVAATFSLSFPYIQDESSSTAAVNSESSTLSGEEDAK